MRACPSEAAVPRIGERALRGAARRSPRGPGDRAERPLSVRHPAACSTRARAMLHGVTADGGAVLLLAFESADQSMRAWIDRALAITREHGGTSAGAKEKVDERGGDASAEGVEAGVRGTRPYLQSALVSRRVIADTFETACAWDPLRGAARAGAPRRRGGDAHGVWRRRAHVPLHPRLPGRPCPVLHVRRRGASGRGGSRSGRSSRTPPATRSSPAGRPSRTTTPSAACIAPGTRRKCRRSSWRRCAPRRRSSIPRGS